MRVEERHADILFSLSLLWEELGGVNRLMAEEGRESKVRMSQFTSHSSNALCALFTSVDALIPRLRKIKKYVEPGISILSFLFEDGSNQSKSFLVQYFSVWAKHCIFCVVMQWPGHATEGMVTTEKAKMIQFDRRAQIGGTKEGKKCLSWNN